MSEKKKVSTCINCTNIRADRLMRGLKDGELPCEFYPPKLGRNKDIIKAFVCEKHEYAKISNFKIEKRKRQMQQQFQQQPESIQIAPGMHVIPIRNPEDLNNFLRKLFRI